MLELTIHDRVAEFRLEVSGDLDEAGARELYLAWHTGLSTVGERPVVVRLRAVRIGPAGAEVLARIREQHGTVIAEAAPAAGRRICEKLCAVPLLRWWCCRA